MFRPCCSPLRRAAFRTLVTSSLTLRNPPESAFRHAPTPLIFVSTKEWDKGSARGMAELWGTLNEKGFTTVVTDINVNVSGVSNFLDILDQYSKELRSTIKHTMTPFAPVFIARSTACLVTQKYISSYPATGLVLISPPLSNTEAGEEKLTSQVEEFTYEPKFPIAVIDTPDRIEEHKARNRLCQGPNPYVDVIPVKMLDGEPLLNAVDKWLDELGV